MKVKLDLEKLYTTKDISHHDVIVRKIRATREIEIPTEFLPHHIRIGGNDFYQDRHLWDVDHDQWVFYVQSGGIGRDHLHEADSYVASLENTGWKIVEDQKNLEMHSFILGRDDAVALIDLAADGLKERGIKPHRPKRWNPNKPWTDFELRDVIAKLCRTARKKDM